MADDTTAITQSSDVTYATTPSWRDTLPDDLKADKSLESFKDVPSLAKSYIETKKLVGTKTEGLVKPATDKSPPEELGAWRKALGVPDAPTGYTIKRPDVVLDGAWDTAAEGQFLAAMHRAGAPPSVVQEAVNFYGQLERQKLEAATADAKRIAAELKNEWGLNFDAKVGRANRAILEFGGTELDDALVTPGHPLNAHGRHPLWIKAWAAVGDALVEHGAMRGDSVETLSTDEAKAKVAELRTELTKLPEAHPRRTELVDQIVAVTNAAQRRRP